MRSGSIGCPPPSRSRAASGWKRSGRALGGDRGYRPAAGPDAACAALARREAAERAAHRLALEVERLRAEGIVAHAALARALTERGNWKTYTPEQPFTIEVDFVTMVQCDRASRTRGVERLSPMTLRVLGATPWEQYGNLWTALRERGIAVGVLSNTIWPRRWHEEIFERDGVLDLIDGAVYTSEIEWTKPHSAAFVAAMRAVGVDDPTRCVFVGDRLFDDIWGAAAARMRTIWVPHSDIPADQHGHSAGEPDATVQRLAEVDDVIARWDTG